LVEGLGPLADADQHMLAHWRQSHATRPRRRAPRVFSTPDEAVAARVAAGDLDDEQVRAIVVRNLVATESGYRWRSDPRLRQTTPVRLAEAQIRRIIAGIDAPTLLMLATPATPYLPSAMMNERAACVDHIRVRHL